MSLEHHQLALSAPAVLIIVIVLNDPSCTFVPEAFACVFQAGIQVYVSLLRQAIQAELVSLKPNLAYVVLAVHLPFDC